MRARFLTFRHAANGEACLHATHGTTVPGLSPPGGSEALSLEFRDIDKVRLGCWDHAHLHLHSPRECALFRPPPPLAPACCWTCA